MNEEKKPTSNPPTSPPPPHGPSIRIIALLILVMIVALAAGVVWNEPLRSTADRSLALLQKISGKHATTQPSENEQDHNHAAVMYYTCGMHPWVVLPKPGDCPICHMELVPLDPAKFTGEIAIDPVVVQNIGVRVETVKQGDLSRIIRSVGTLQYDETRLVDVSVRTRSRIVKWHNTCCIGNLMEKGASVAQMFSPDVIATSRELLLAQKNRTLTEQAAESAKGSVTNIMGNVFDATKNKLKLMGVTDAYIDELLKTGIVPDTYTITFPVGGVIQRLEGNVGKWIDEGGTIAVVADPSVLWVFAWLNEQQLALVKLGDTAAITFASEPNKTYTALVDSISTEINPTTRQGRARLTLENPDQKLRTGMYATIELRSLIAAQATLLPRSAILDTGTRSVAMVSLGRGKFEPRDLKIGMENEEGLVQVFEGVKPGEEVVISGQFLLDSESRTREALAKMIKGTPASQSHAAESEAGENHDHTSH